MSHRSQNRNFSDIRSGEHDINREQSLIDDKYSSYDSGTTDSGFLSGAIQSEQNIEEQETMNGPVTYHQSSSSYQNTRNYSDSGYLEDDSTRQDSGAIVDSSTSYSSLSQQFSNLDIDKTPTHYQTSVKQQQHYQCLDENTIKNFFYPNENGDTQLHIAILEGYIEVVYSLIRLAPEPYYLDIPNDHHESPLHLAVLKGQSKLVRALLVAGANPGVRDKNGNTPLHLACIHGYYECVFALLTEIQIEECMHLVLRYNVAAYNVPRTITLIDEENYDGQRCVHLAACGDERGHVEVLNILVSKGANINAIEGKCGRTALHISVERSRRLNVEFLIKYCKNLDINKKTFSGYTAHDIAIYSDRHIATVLNLSGAKLSYIESDDDETDSDMDNEEEKVLNHLCDGFIRQAIVA